jgi:uncharacterized protein YPO0396
LQATNEELETNNEELQATNEELQTTNDELTARTIELQELTKQYRVEQLQLSVLLERFPHYVMVLDAEKLTIQAINPAYKQLVGNRDVQGLPLTELLNGPEVSDLMTAINTAVSEAQSQTIGPILASVDHNTIRYIHTLIPISDASGTTVTRLFIYSEKAEKAEQTGAGNA